MSDEATEREVSVAVHEAGHAVACFLLHKAFRYVSIQPEDDSWGRAKMRAPITPNPDVYSDLKWRAWAEREIMVAFAGEVAQYEFGFEPESGSEGDVKDATRLLLSQSGNIAEAEAYNDWLYQRTISLMSRPGNRAATEALADALLEKNRIGYRSARKIISDAFQSPPTEEAT